MYEHMYKAMLNMASTSSHTRLQDITLDFQKNLKYLLSAVMQIGMKNWEKTDMGNDQTFFTYNKIGMLCAL